MERFFLQQQSLDNKNVKGKKVRNIPCTLVLVANATMDFAGNGKTGL